MPPAGRVDRPAGRSRSPRGGADVSVKLLRRHLGIISTAKCRILHSAMSEEAHDRRPSIQGRRGDGHEARHDLAIAGRRLHRVEQYRSKRRRLRSRCLPGRLCRPTWCCRSSTPCCASRRCRAAASRCSPQGVLTIEARRRSGSGAAWRFGRVRREPPSRPG